MRKFCRLCGLLLLTAAVPILLTGCRTTPAEDADSTAPVTIAYVDEWNGEGTYYLTTLLDQYTHSHPDMAVTAQPFSSHDAFVKQISTEMAAGKGPDVLLLSDYSTMNWKKMSLNGRFAGLSRYMEADADFSRQNYFEPALDAGLLDEEQYIFPLSFKCTCLCTSREKLAQSGFSGEQCTYEEMLNLLDSSVRTAQADPEWIPIVLDIDSNDFLSPLLSAFQVPIADLQTGEILLPEDTLRELCDYLKLLNETRPIHENRKRIADYASRSENYPQIGFYLRTYGFPTWLGAHERMMETVGETSQVFLMPSCTDPDSRTGFLSFYGAVNNSSGQKSQAYRVLRELADSARGEGIGWNFPVSRESFRLWLEENVVGQSWSMEIDGSAREIIPTQEYADRLSAAAESVTYVTAENWDTLHMIDECMLPYIEGSGDFEDCYRQAVNRLRLYVNE